MAAQPPAFQNQHKSGARWRRTPPAIFPPILGLYGLAAAWGRTADTFSMPPAIGQVLMGAVTLLYLYAAGSYLAKVAARPGVVIEDLKTLPGRAGLSTMSMAGMLLAVALIPYWVAAAKVALVLALFWHAMVAVLVSRALLAAPPEARRVTPVFHLVYVGFIVSPFALVQVGWTWLALPIFWLSLAAAVAIWAASVVQFIDEVPPAPLRPLLAIHLAPVSLLGTVAMLLQMPLPGLVFGVIGILLMAAYLIFGRWIVAAGFSPFWGAFTFPLAAFASLAMVLGSAGYGGLFRLVGALVLVGASAFIPWIALKVGQMWMRGALAEKTNAARA